MIKQSQERAASIPNYIISSSTESKYNGIPKHLQNMYNKLNREKESN